MRIDSERIHSILMEVYDDVTFQDDKDSRIREIVSALNLHPGKLLGRASDLACHTLNTGIPTIEKLGHDYICQVIASSIRMSFIETIENEDYTDLLSLLK